MENELHISLADLLTNQMKEAVMNKQTMIGNWKEKKGKLKQKYAKLTDDDLKYVEGKEEELYGRIQKRLGVSKREAQRMVDTI